MSQRFIANLVTSILLLVSSINMCPMLSMQASNEVGSPSWTQIIPHNIPSVRYDSSMAYDSGRNVIVLFGGISYGFFPHDTFEFSGGVWTPRASANGLSPQDDGPVAYDSIRGETILYGCGQTWVWDGTNWTLKHPLTSPSSCKAGIAFDAQRGVAVLFAADGTTWEWDGANWTEKITVHSPSPRETTLAYDSDRGKIILFGGRVGHTLYNDIWEYDGIDWTFRPTAGDVPPPRGVTEIVYDTTTKRTVLYGGLTCDPNCNFYGDTWNWDGNTGTWTERTPAVNPGPRNTSYAFDSSRGVTVLFGGQLNLYSYGDTWEWNDALGTWTNTITQTHPPTNPPPERGGAYDSVRNETVIFGGNLFCCGEYDSSETWILANNATKWEKRNPVTSPPARSNHMMAFDPQRGVTVLFGGTSPTGNLNDTWEWDGTNWTQRQPVNSPGARHGASITYDSGRGVVVLFGGRDYPHNDTWEWDGTNWIQRFPVHSPPPRAYATMAYDEAREKVVLFGGHDPGYFQDTWEWDGTDWVERTPLNLPSARYAHGMAYDELRNRIVLHGGLAGGAFVNDTWEWDGTNWTLITPTNDPPPPNYGLFVYDSSRAAFIFLSFSTWKLTVSPPNTPPTVNAGGPYTVNEGSSVSVTATGNDPDGDTITYAWDLDNDGNFETSGQTVTFSALGLDGPSGQTVVVRAIDEGGLSDTDPATINVLNVAPTIDAITAPINPIQVNTSINVNASFTDPGTPDTHSAVWDWGDNSTTPGTVTETNGSGSVSGSHTYTASGVYTVKITVTDDDGDSDEAIFQYVVVYDPNGGFVTGGGWINSPAGAYTPDPSLTGQANFGFVSKYQKGATIPTGQTEFQFHVANLNFKSTSYDWLVIAGKKAQYKGTGTINGAGNYGFMLTAIDGSPDKFRIKIWDKITDEVIYDNQLGAEDTADPATAIQGGSIVIHKAK